MLSTRRAVAACAAAAVSLWWVPVRSEAVYDPFPRYFPPDRNHGGAAHARHRCPWDLEQTFATIEPYTIEEAYEVADAIERGDLDDLREELGDLLLQVVFHARMAEEQNAFAFGDVVEAVTQKMIRRHPHVFGDAQAAFRGHGQRLMG